jgi:preprotein translocase subunit SecD
MPGVKNAQRALELVGQTAELRFRPVLSTFPPPAPGATTTTSSSSTTSTTAAGATTSSTAAGATTSSTVASSTTSTTAAGATTSTTVAGSSTSTTVAGEPGTERDESCGADTTQPSEDEPEQTVTLPEKQDGKTVLCYILGPSALTGSAVSGAQAEIPQGEWVVSVDLKNDGLDAFNAIAQTCFNQDATQCPTRQLAIVLDGLVESAPRIQPDNPTFEPFGANGVTISGSFTEGEAKDLALVLRYGSLPVELVPQTVQTVSATLGKDSLHAGLVAGFIGVALVALYMLLYYRALGLVVIVGLCIWSAINFSIITYLSQKSGLALSLAGVTGIIVSVGVTVDSYVVFFERLKDEIRSGKTVRSSVDRGFKRAFRTILAADISSFIGAILLFWLTVGAVRGFAFFLGLSTVLDVLTAYFFTRPTVALLGRSRFFTEAKWVGVARGLGRELPVAAAPAGGGR